MPSQTTYPAELSVTIEGGRGRSLHDANRLKTVATATENAGRLQKGWEDTRIQESSVENIHHARIGAEIKKTSTVKIKITQGILFGGSLQLTPI